jgi:hypothetical protein
VLVRLALVLLRARRRALEKQIRPPGFDVRLSRELDGLVVALEALEALR